MNIGLNGKTYETGFVQSQFNNYASYLEGVLKGNYRLSEDEIKFLNIDEANIETEVTQLLKNIKQFSSDSNDYNNYDFNADGKVNTDNNDDINLLSLILESKFTDPGSIKNTQAEFYNKDSANIPDDIKAIFAKKTTNESYKTDAVIKTEGGFYIAMNQIEAFIYDSNFNLVSLISGDPHVYEYDPDTQKNTGHWNYSDDSVFILPDGTKLGLNSRQWSEKTADEKIHIFCGIYVKTDDSVLVYGSEYGENRDNSLMKDDTEGTFIRKVRDLEIDPEVWDAENIDANGTNYRNGTFVLDGQNHWMKLMEDGSFKDVKDETFSQFRLRDGKEILTNSTGGTATRDQYISTLDGKDRKNFTKLASSNFGGYQTDVENDFLLQRSKFTPEVLNILNTVSKLNPGNFNYTKVYDGSLSEFQQNFLNFISTPNTTLSTNPERDLLMKNYLFQKYFNEAVPNIDLNALTQADRDILNLAERLINTSVGKQHPFNENINQILNNFDNYSADINTLLSQVNFLECTKDLPVISNEEINTSFKTLLSSKFFNVDNLDLQNSQETLSDQQEEFIATLSSTIKLNEDDSHMYHPAFNKFLGSLYSSESFSILKQSGNSGATRLGSASNRLGQMNKAGSPIFSNPNSPTPNASIQYVMDLLDEPNDGLDKLSDKSELLATLKNEVTSQDRIDNINTVKAFYQTEITSFEEQISKLEQEIAQYQSYNSALAKKQIKNLQAKIYALNSKVQKTSKAITNLPNLI